MLRTLIWVGFFLRLFVAAWNSFFGPSPGADLDALTFHIKASEASANLDFIHFEIGWIYVQFLGLVYFLTTDSLFIGCLLSCVAWFFSARIFVGSMRLLSVNMTNQIIALLIYSLLPSSILFTAITLREPFQLLFINVGVYALLKIFLQSSRIYWLVLIFALIGASVLHGALLAFSSFLVFLLVFAIILRKINWNLMMGAFIFGFFLYISSLFFTIFGDLTTYRLEDGISKAIELFHQNALITDARTNYKATPDLTGGDLGFLFFIVISFIQYIFEPFIWNVSTVGDFVLTLEGVLRGYLIFRALSAIFNDHEENQIALILIFILYLALTIIFSMGTTNWGTAARHHVPSLGLILLVSFGLMKLQKKRKTVVRKFITRGSVKSQ